MYFLNPQADEAFYRELTAEGVLRPEDRAKMEHTCGSPETGTLNSLLMAGAELVNKDRWLSWLVRGYGYPRVQQIKPEAFFIKSNRYEPARIKIFLETNNYPCRKLPNGGVVVAVGRPDLISAIERALAPTPFEPMAASLPELKAIRKLYEEELTRV
jgi:hypothetical protein